MDQKQPVDKKQKLLTTNK